VFKDAKFGWMAQPCGSTFQAVCQLPLEGFKCRPPLSPPPPPPSPPPPPFPPLPPSCELRFLGTVDAQLQ
jgi:hypothetical protein